jgi:hypothetical protein
VLARVSSKCFSQCRWKDHDNLQYFLKNETNQDEIKEYREIWEFFNQNDDEDEKKATKQSSIGTASKSREEQEQEEKLKKSKKERLKILQDKISKNFVDSIWFFDLDQKFGMLTIFFQVTGATSYNSCSDLPALLLILILTASWPFRKKHSWFYRKFNIFLFYFIIVSMFI